MTTDTRILDLNTLHLAVGRHDTPDDGLCLLEAAAYMAGEAHSDRPACVSPVLGVFGRQLNDVLPDDRRQELKPLLPNLLGTAGDGLDETRAYMALDWLVRTYTPTWLDMTGLTAEAATLRDLRRIADLTAARTAGPVVRAAQIQAAAAGAAARAAADNASWATAWAAARATAGGAAGATARATARAAAGVAAWATADNASWAAARAAADNAAGAAAWATAWAAAGAAAGVTAGAAARARIALTVDELQGSALALYWDMIRPEASHA